MWWPYPWAEATVLVWPKPTATSEAGRRATLGLTFSIQRQTGWAWSHRLCDRLQPCGGWSGGSSEGKRGSDLPGSNAPPRCVPTDTADTGHTKALHPYVHRGTLLITTGGSHPSTREEMMKTWCPHCGL